MASTAVLANGYFLELPKPTPVVLNRTHPKRSNCFTVRSRVLFGPAKSFLVLSVSKPSSLSVGSFKQEDAQNCEASMHQDIEDEKTKLDKILRNQKTETSEKGVSFLASLGMALGLAATITLVRITLKGPGFGSPVEIQSLAKSSSSSVTASSAGFSFKAFGYKFILPEYAPGWVYFWLLMAAGCGLFISEEALNIWVGISLSRKLTLDRTWQAFAESLSQNAPYILSTVLWVYWGVCISDMIPFYLGKLFRQSGGSEDVCSKLGIGKEKALSITEAVQKYGNLIGAVERFALGVRNPTAFLAGALGISPECFFAGVCCGGLITLPLQLGIGFLLRERPVFALATVATAVGIWTIFPYAVAASTALFLFLRRRYST